MKWILKSIKWLVYTNLYIAVAAVCFQATAYYFKIVDSWSLALSSTTFFSTWLVYQFSRYHFHRNYDTHPNGKENGIYNYVNSHQSFLKASIVIALIGTIVSIYFLKKETILAMALLGVISILYPIRYKNWSLRSIPFLKIFLIAFVWAATATCIPAIQEGIILSSRFDLLSNVLPFFIFNFIFIIYITIPFDMHDIAVDKGLNVKTIPAILGIRGSRVLTVFLGLILIVIALLLLRFDLVIMLTIVMILILGIIMLRNVERLHKWQIMAIYDGSMIILFLILWLDNVIK